MTGPAAWVSPALVSALVLCDHYGAGAIVPQRASTLPGDLPPWPDSNPMTRFPGTLSAAMSCRVRLSEVTHPHEPGCCPGRYHPSRDQQAPFNASTRVSTHGRRFTLSDLAPPRPRWGHIACSHPQVPCPLGLSGLPSTWPPLWSVVRHHPRASSVPVARPSSVSPSPSCLLFTAIHHSRLPSTTQYRCGLRMSRGKIAWPGIFFSGGARVLGAGLSPVTPDPSPVTHHLLHPASHGPMITPVTTLSLGLLQGI